MVLSGAAMALLAGLVAYLGASWVQANAERLGLVQAPNARSSHTRPTPQGGGIGIVLGGSLGGLLAASQSVWPGALILVSALAIAAIGLWDDIRPLKAGLRLLAQALLFALVVILAVPLAPLSTTLGFTLPGFVLAALAVLGGVYWINLFNFMDGIDGLAGSEALFMCLAAAGLALASVPGITSDPLYWWLVAVGTAATGFLVLNWPPARIFMGDAGSTFLGFVIGYFALATTALGWLGFWTWAILGATFATDATVTLIRRLLQGERVFEAHRRHAYQVLSRRFGSHRRVTLIYAGINLCWLLPLAGLAQVLEGQGWMLAAIAYGPLVVLALHAGAGRAEAAEARHSLK